MAYLYSFLLLAGVCAIAQLIYEYTKLTPGHITSLYVVIGVALETFGIYDFLLRYAPGGASLPILSFGHLLAHAVVEGVRTDGFMGILTAMFVPASASLAVVLLWSVLVAVVGKPKP